DPHRPEAAGGECLLAPLPGSQIASHQGEVDLLRPARLEGGVQGAMRVGSQPKEDDATRVAVEAVDRKGIRRDFPDELRKGWFALVAAPGCGRKARRFVDRKDEIVAMQHPQHFATLAPGARPVHRTLPRSPAPGDLASRRPPVAWRSNG